MERTLRIATRPNVKATSSRVTVQSGEATPFGRVKPSTSPRTAFRFCLLNGLGRVFVVNGASELPVLKFVPIRFFT